MAPNSGQNQIGGVEVPARQSQPRSHAYDFGHPSTSAADNASRHSSGEHTTISPSYRLPYTEPMSLLFQQQFKIFITFQDL